MIEMHTEFYLENLKGRDDVEDVDVCVRILQWLVEKWGAKVCTGLIWLRKRDF
jgi:hypothetical protein